MTFTRWFVIALVAGGCHREVVPSAPMASIAPANACPQCGGKPIALGTPLQLTAVWSGVCDNGPSFNLGLGAYWGGGDTRSTTHSCNHVSFTTQVACAGDACRIENQGQTVIPTKPGALQATVTMTPKGDGQGRTIDLDPVVVAVPARLDARCTIDADNMATVEIELVNRSVLLYDPRAVQVSADGERCPSLGELGQREVVVNDEDSPDLGHTYRCRAASSQLLIEAKTEDVVRSAWVSCTRS